MNSEMGKEGVRIFNVLLVLGAVILAATWVLQIGRLRKGSIYSQ